MLALFSFIGKDLLGSLLMFPLWWYGEGFKGLIDWTYSELSFRWRSYAITLWFKNILVPMYGENDWWGRIISVIMRFAVIIGRLIAMLIEILIYVVLALFWLLAPLAFIIFFLLNVSSGFLFRTVLSA